MDDEMDLINIKDLVLLFISKWRWFVASVVFCLIIAVAFIKITQPTYQLNASVQVKDESKAGSSISNEMAAFSSMGLFQSSQNVVNEMHIISSSSTISDVVRELDLELSYFKGSFPHHVVYGSQLPVTLKLDDDKAKVGSFSMTIDLLDNNVVEITNIVASVNGVKVEYDDEIKANLSQSINTPVGVISVVKNPSYIAKEQDNIKSINVSKSSNYSTIERYREKLSISLKEKGGSTISISMVDESYNRALDFLTTLINVYNINWIKDKNTITNSSSDFIDERLLVIEAELSGIDDEITQFQSDNLIPNIDESVKGYMEKISSMEDQRISLHNRIYMAEFIQNYLADEAHADQLLPSNSGLGSDAVETQILEYNRLQLNRNSLVVNSSELNPLVKELDMSLKAQHKAISTSIANLLITLNAQSDMLNSEMDKINEDLASSPLKAKSLFSVQRQQKIAEGLYLFLLQKREENKLSQTFMAYNTKVIDYPQGKPSPSSPRKLIILFAAILIGGLIPALVIFLMESLNTSIRCRDDLSSVTIPFAGELPLVGAKPGSKKITKGLEDSQFYNVVVKEKSRNIINEGFRVIRTNIEFMATSYGKSKVLMLVSINPNSGKTFTSINLATSFAINKKKVLLIDLDMRKATLSQLVNSPKKGIANYLNSTDDVKNYIIKSGVSPYLDVIPGGALPPNPTELLLGDRLAELIANVREDYEYIFIDCPPIDIIADSTIINKHVDMTLFIARAEVLDKRVLPYLEQLYTENKLKNMAFILNGTVSQLGRKGTYGRYGGYGSYGITDDED